MSKASPILKWMAGILATVLGAVIIWLLTHQGGLLNPVEKKPDIKFLEIAMLDSVSPGQNLDITVTVLNEGETTGENCQIYLYEGYHNLDDAGPLPNDASIRQNVRAIGGIAAGEKNLLLSLR